MLFHTFAYVLISFVILRTLFPSPFRLSDDYFAIHDVDQSAFGGQQSGMGGNDQYGGNSGGDGGFGGGQGQQGGGGGYVSRFSQQAISIVCTMLIFEYVHLYREEVVIPTTECPCLPRRKMIGSMPKLRSVKINLYMNGI